MIFDHIGVVVNDLATGRRFLTETLKIGRWSAVFDDPVNGVILQFGADDRGACYELLQPAGEHSPVRAALKSGRAILNHLAYLVADLEQAAERLVNDDCVPISEPKPAIAYGGRRIQFFLTPLNMIVELIEAPDHRHDYAWVEPAERRDEP